MILMADQPHPRRRDPRTRQDIVKRQHRSHPFRLDEDRFWFSLASSDVLFYAKRLAAHGAPDVEIREAEAAPLQVQGPRSRELVGDLFGNQAAGLGYYRFTRASADGPWMKALLRALSLGPTRSLPSTAGTRVGWSATRRQKGADLRPGAGRR